MSKPRITIRYNRNFPYGRNVFFVAPIDCAWMFKASEYVKSVGTYENIYYHNGSYWCVRMPEVKTQSLSRILPY